MKRNGIALGLCLLLMLPAAGCTAADHTEQETPQDNMRAMGEHDAAYEKESSVVDTEKGTVLYAGKNVRITQEELDRVMGRTAAGGNTAETESGILAVIASNESLYYQAVEAGTAVSETEVAAAIRQDRQALEEADNYPDIEAYFEGLGMTADEYWDSRKTDRIYLRDLTINKYLTGLQQDLLAEGTLASPDEWPEALALLSVEAVLREEIRSVSTGAPLEIEYGPESSYMEIKDFDSLKE